MGAPVIGAMTRESRSFSTVAVGSDGGEGREDRWDFKSASEMPCVVPFLYTYA